MRMEENPSHTEQGLEWVNGEQKDVEIRQLQDRCSVETHLKNSHWRFLIRWSSLHW